MGWNPRKSLRKATKHVGGIARGARDKVLNANPIVSHASDVATSKLRPVEKKIAKGAQHWAHAPDQAFGNMFKSNIEGLTSSVKDVGAQISDSFKQGLKDLSNAYETSVTDQINAAGKRQEEAIGAANRDREDRQGYASEFTSDGRQLTQDWYESRPDNINYDSDSRSWIQNRDIGDTRQITGQIDQRLSGIGDVNSTGQYTDATQDLNRLRGIATTEGPTSLAQSQLSFQEAQQQEAMDALRREQAGQVNNAMDTLALTGGASGGARERLMNQADTNQMNAKQNLYNQGNQQRLGIIAQDEQRKLGLMQQLPGQALTMDQYQTGLARGNQQMAMNKAGMYANALQGDARSADARDLQQAQMDIGVDAQNAMTAKQQIDQQNLYEQEGWQKYGDILGSNYTADAMLAASSNQGGGFMGMGGGGGTGMLPGMLGNMGNMPGAPAIPGLTTGTGFQDLMKSPVLNPFGQVGSLFSQLGG